MRHKGRHGLDTRGLRNIGQEVWALPSVDLHQEAVRRREGLVAHLGPLVVSTGHHSGRSPRDTLVVREPSCEGRIWWGESQPTVVAQYRALRARLNAFLPMRELCRPGRRDSASRGSVGIEWAGRAVWSGC